MTNLPPRAPRHASLCLAILALAVMWAAPAAHAAGPKLAVYPPVFDFGIQETNRGSYSFAFLFRNEGSERLVIQTVRPSCGCTTTELGTTELAPGKETTLRGTFRTASYEGDISRTIMVQSNDAEQSSKRLELKIALPFAGSGARLWPQGGKYFARLKDDVWTASAWLENCEKKQVIKVTALDLPAGWTCSPALPLPLQPGERLSFTLTRAEAGDGSTKDKDVSFLVHTDFVPAQEIKGTVILFRAKTQAPPAAAPAATPAAATPPK